MSLSASSDIPGSSSRSRSPTPRAPSPPSRPSVSSNRSRRGSDFEHALASDSTLFLSSSARMDEAEDPTRPLATVLEDASVPIEMRSFEDDLGAASGPSTPATPAKMRSPGVIPPTPASGHARMPSGASVGSTESQVSAAKSGPSKVSRPSLGIDAELGEKSPPKSAPVKRRSFFRSPGTASSPDLATLVRKAKESKPSPALPPQPVNPLPASTSVNASPASSARAGTASTASTSQVPHSSSVASYSSMSSYGTPSMGSSPQKAESSRTVSHGVNGDKVDSPRGAKTPDDGFRSMRSRAKGVFGRMFGSSKDSPQSTPSSRAVSTPSRPPVPNVPPDMRHSKLFPSDTSAGSTPHLSADVFGRSLPATPSLQQDGPLQSRSNVSTPGPSPLSSDNPRPAVQKVESPSPSTPSVSSTVTRSRHTRQLAEVGPDDEAGLSPRSHPGSPSRVLDSFVSDMTGAFDEIGQSDPARELGLPIDTLRAKRPGADSSSSKRRALLIYDSGPSGDQALSQDEQSANDRLSPIPSARTTSLPSLASPAILDTSPQPSVMSRTSSHDHNDATAATKTAEADFGPSLDDSSARKDDTIRASKGIPASVQTIKLVASPPLGINPLLPQSEPLSGLVTPVTPELRTPIEPSPNTEGLSGSSTEDDSERGRRLACEFLEGDESTVSSEKVAIFLGGSRPVNRIALRYYMQYFDMKGKTLVESFRELCQKLHLKAESQEIDRIIEGFSERYYDCNPGTIFASSGVVHTVTGAMLMLNTDLHIADLSKHMSRADFIRNVLRAIQESQPGTIEPVASASGSQVAASHAGLPETYMASMPKIRPTIATSDSSRTTASGQRSASAPVSTTNLATSINGRPGFDHLGNSSGSGSLPFTRAWEAEAENALRDIYSAVRSDRILLPISAPPSHRQSTTSLGGSSTNLDLSRRGTLRSPANRSGSARLLAGQRSSVYGMQDGLFSDGRLSPNGSFATSMNDLGAYMPTIGFASNLSHTVIREHDDESVRGSDTGSLSTLDEMNDDELALLGPPWAKEGMLWYKPYWESAGKRAKKGDWKQHFVVVQKGDLLMFTFGEKGGGSSSFSLPVGGSVGGGNWLNNANVSGSMSLLHAVAVSLPSPGYSPQRPYVLSLALPSGESSFLQAGTEDLVTEWVSTINYWAARKSRQALQGGVSNMEYGWNRVADFSTPHKRDASEDLVSVRSGRSNRSRLTYGSYGRNKSSGMLDRIHINDWKPAPANLVSSNLDEEAQLDALQVFLRSLREELDEHKYVEDGLSRMYSPGSKNAMKAQQNYKAKLQYLQSEIYKYEIYIEALKSAVRDRLKKQGDRGLERSLARSAASLRRVGVHEEDDEEMPEARHDRERTLTGNEAGGVTPSASRVVHT